MVPVHLIIDPTFGIGLRLTHEMIRQPEPFWDMVSQSIELYDTSLAQGSYIFAGDVLASMNSSLWAAYAFEEHLSRELFPFLGAVDVAVVDAVSRYTLTCTIFSRAL